MRKILKATATAVAVIGAAYWLSALAILALIPRLNSGIEELAAQDKAYVVPMQGDEYTVGTGVLVNMPGNAGTYILTNEHVCEALYTNNLVDIHTTVDEQAYGPLFVVKASKAVDLCLVLVPALIAHPGLSVIPRSFYVFGEALLTLGYPNGGPLVPQTGFFVGSVQGHFLKPILPTEICEGRTVIEPNAATFYCATEQSLEEMTDPVYPGNSGSPVFNSRNELIGLVNSTDTRSHYGNFISGATIVKFLGGK